MSEQPKTIYARSVWADHLGRFVVCGASATPHDGRVEYVLKSDVQARLAAAEKMADALEWYADSANYETAYERLPCDCCTDIYEPINRDKGQVARAARAAWEAAQ